MKKYEFTGETKKVKHVDGSEITLRQIRSVRNFENEAVQTLIDDRTLGGWIQDESNLSHEGTCWLDTTSQAYGQSIIAGNAYVQASILCDEAIVEDDTYVYRSYVYEKALVCGHSNVQYSEIWGDSVIGQLSAVYYSKLKNVRTPVGSSDFKTWKRFTFEKSCLRSDSYLIEINESSSFMNVNLSGRKIRFHAQSTLTNVNGNVNKFLVEAPLTMKNVKVEDKTIVKFKKHPIGGSTVIGNEEVPIILDSENLILLHCDIAGSVKIKGAWIIEKTSITDFAVLQNDWTERHYIQNSTFSDCSSLLCKEEYSNDTTKASYQLSMDDGIVIE